MIPASRNQAVSQALPAGSRRRSAAGRGLQWLADLKSNSKQDQIVRDTFWMQVDSCLDLASLEKVQQVIRASRFDQHKTKRVVIDMKKTRDVFDSGMELLFFLYRQSGTLRDNLYIVNANDRVRERLGGKGLDECFHLRKGVLN
jgi:anti-anti-sigma regulatory factor